MLQTSAQRLFETLFGVERIGIGESCEKVKPLLIYLPPQPYFTADHIPLFPLEVAFDENMASRAVLEIGQHFFLYQCLSFA